ncbi:MAG: Phosphate acyltransferase [Verrucomicrobiota bacterium]|jgi:glycerol-3-phosphate acyltransferase PlsX
MRIALDAMGGDFAPANLVEGATLALREYSHISKLFLVGDTAAIEAELRRLAFSDNRIEIVHSTQVVSMSDAATDSVRRKRDSSISRAVDLVKSGAAEAIVSAGHTGAAVAASQIKLRSLPGVERPAIGAVIPTETNYFLLIDAGANTDPTPKQLVQNAIMGAAYSRHVLGYANPSIGLMSIGTEDEKGNEFTKEVFDLLKASKLNFRGNVEGHDLFENPVEVVVCDGFVGNIMLKTVEAIAKAIFHWLKSELLKSPVRMAGAWLARDAFRTIKTKTNADEYGGMPLLGVNGNVIIAHGGSSAYAIKNALRVGAETIRHQINPQIIEEVKRYNELTTSHEQPQP